MERYRVTLRGGWPAPEGWCRSLWLRAPAGADSAFLAELPAALPAATVTSLLLGRLISLAEEGEPAGPAFARALCVGDREALLLALRQLVFGDSFELHPTCPHCREALDLPLSVPDLLVRGQGPASLWHQAELREEGPSGQGQGLRVRFRLPNGEDQELAAGHLPFDPRGAVERVLERCLAAPEGPSPEVPGTSESIENTGLPEMAGTSGRLPEWAVRLVVERMAELDPQADVRLEMSCPACGRPFAWPFDAGAWVLGELRGAGERLFAEVHWLARAYHWREADILALSDRRRRRYLGLLTADSGARSRP